MRKWVIKSLVLLRYEYFQHDHKNPANYEWWKWSHWWRRWPRQEVRPVDNAYIVKLGISVHVKIPKSWVHVVLCTLWKNTSWPIVERVELWWSRRARQTVTPVEEPFFNLYCKEHNVHRSNHHLHRQNHNLLQSSLFISGRYQPQAWTSFAVLAPAEGSE